MSTNQTEKLFTVAGTVTDVNGVTKVRYANDLVSRIKILNKANCTNINLIELPKPMTKVEALEYLMSVENSSMSKDVIESKLREKTQVKKVKREITVEGLLDAIGKRPTINQQQSVEIAV